MAAVAGVEHEQRSNRRLALALIGVVLLLTAVSIVTIVLKL